jgi:cell division protein FtsB
MGNMLRKTGYAIALGVLSVCGLIAFRGPQGVPALMQKRTEIRSLQEQNADLSKDNEQKRDRIQRLRDSQAEQELEIRKRLKLVRPGETSFILPDVPKPTH